MNREEFKNYIESIGFIYERTEDFDRYVYKKYRIDLASNYYHFYNGSEWDSYELNDLTPLAKEFKKELRSIKLKQILK